MALIERIALADLLNAESMAAAESQTHGLLVSDAGVVASGRDSGQATIPGIVDTVFAYISYSIDGLSFIENLTLVGPGRLNGTGNAQANVLTGAEGRNRLNALGGDDIVIGLAGNDTLKGMDGNDELDGGSGNDHVTGGAGRDTLGRSYGNDRLLGQGGKDFLEDVDGTNLLAGGGGNDVLLIHVNSGQGRAHGGRGQDTYLLIANRGDRDYVIADLETGNGGDLIDVNDLLRQSMEFGYGGGSPIAGGFLRFEQSAGNALLQWDPDGASTVYGASTQLTILGVNASDLAGSLAGIPSGEPSVGETVVGGDLSDVLIGGSFADELTGGDGADTLHGGYGDDHLLGSNGHDLLIGGGGNDTMFGEGGNDEFSADRSFGDDFLVGGAGDDVFRDFAGRNTMHGGDGNDVFHVFVYANGLGAGSTVSGGAGRDTYDIEGSGASRTYVVSDFQAGPTGDRIDVDSLLADSAEHGYDGTNSSQFIRLFQSEEDALLQWDADGAATGTAWLTMLTLQGIDARTITRENFGKELNGLPGDDWLAGGLGNDTINSHEGNDTLEGAEGDDILDGGAGVDVLRGGVGADTYYVDDLSDVITEQSGEPAGLLVPDAGEPGGAGIRQIGDTVIASINYSLANVAFVENLTLSGSASRATGNVLANRITGNTGADRLSGGDGNDTLDGGAGNDLVNGDAGNDVLIWGPGDRIEGGAGDDTLRLKAGDLDLTAVADSALAGIEAVDLRKGGASALTLIRADVLALNGADTLRVLGDAGDAVNALGFARSGSLDGFKRYTSGAATLLVDGDITVTT